MTNSLERGLQVATAGGMVAAYTAATLGLVGAIGTTKVLPAILLGALFSFLTGVLYFAMAQHRRRGLGLKD